MQQLSCNLQPATLVLRRGIAGVAATAPALPATLPANTSLNYMQPNFELRRSATTFTPGAEVHRTPIKATSAAAAAASEDEELCMWLQQRRLASHNA